MAAFEAASLSKVASTLAYGRTFNTSNCLGCAAVFSPVFNSVRYLDFPLQLRDLKRRQRPVARNENRPQYKWDQVDRFKKLAAYGGYTTKPLKINQLSGIDPATGRRQNQKVDHHWGGFPYYEVDRKRYGPTDGTFLEEKVLEIKHSFMNTPFLALVASRKAKRWIVATHGIKPGDIIRTSSYIPPITIEPKDGDAYPVGALPPGTKIHCVEPYPGMGSKWLCEAGMCGEVVRKCDEGVIIRIPQKEVCIREECMVTVGQVSRPGYDREDIGSAQLASRLGIKSSSGLWHQKEKWRGRGVKYQTRHPVAYYNLGPSPEYKEEDKPFVTAFKPNRTRNFWLGEKMKITLNRRDCNAHFGVQASNLWLFDMNTSPHHK